jgi:hypothetical protein
MIRLVEVEETGPSAGHVTTIGKILSRSVAGCR